MLGLFPEQVREVLVAQLDDEDFYLTSRAAKALGNSGDAVSNRRRGHHTNRNK
ncbi:MAG TPA: hypothetical protein PLJ78_13015 [Anaerolineae bacterium]|nr:hypothetical protein [Anaerolineae bacterium]HQK14850.1 hypothetical protein [Anaerolineae bacterium]